MQIQKYKYTNTQIQFKSNLQIDLTCAIFLKSRGCKDIKYDILSTTNTTNTTSTTRTGEPRVHEYHKYHEYHEYQEYHDYRVPVGTNGYQEYQEDQDKIGGATYISDVDYFDGFT